MLATYQKNPNDTLDYDPTFAIWMTTGDTISGIVTAVAPSGNAGDMTVVTTYNNSPSVKVWLTGGNEGVPYVVTVKITTAGGRVKTITFKVKVKTQ